MSLCYFVILMFCIRMFWDSCWILNCIIFCFIIMCWGVGLMCRFMVENGMVKICLIWGFLLLIYGGGFSIFLSIWWELRVWFFDVGSIICEMKWLVKGLVIRRCVFCLVLLRCFWLWMVVLRIICRLVLMWRVCIRTCLVVRWLDLVSVRTNRVVCLCYWFLVSRVFV